MNEQNKELNTIQVGGDHYRHGNLPQHWDLAIMYQWDPFQYQITKYVMRWKDKHPTPAKRLEDLKKARHFLDKYIANFEAYDTHAAPPVPTPQEVEPIKGLTVTEVPSVAQQVDAMMANQARIFGHDPEKVPPFMQDEGYYGDGSVLLKCKVCRMTGRWKSYNEAAIQHAQCGKSWWSKNGGEAAEKAA